MRSYDKAQKLIQITCNGCGRTVVAENDILKEDFFSCNKSWGYFSNRDGEKDCWDLCEECYQRLVSSFKIKMETYEKTELMDE